ncbi:malonate--CoA ligase [Halocynthiibacter namhaensis]|uniref:malonate--CoA ligase n=1 Tax=Halocynthiibacter namhaensis TaxID=1290553 RepID=UPI000579840F|nr:malonyl-CoA synthase [Halocynthiibacter namhaensis]
MPNLIFDSLMRPWLFADTPFLHMENGEVISHKAFFRRVAQFANAMPALGLAAGDRLAAQVDKSDETLALYLGCIQAGIVFLPLNTAYTASEVAYFLEDSGAKAMICTDAKRSDMEPIAKRCEAALLTLQPDGCGSLNQMADRQANTANVADRAADDLAALLYTSGTTGRSKGAMLTHKNLASNAQALKELWQISADDVLLHALPIYHTHGLFVATFTTLAAGGSMIFLPKFDVDAICALMPKATTMMGVPTFYTRLLDAGGFTKDVFGKMRLFVSGSAPLLAETHMQFQDRTGHRILERYGMTETNMSTSNPYDGERRPGTVGFPLPGVEIRITCPETGKHVSDGEIGVLEVRGDNVFAGYWNMPKKTKEELRDDGFFITGDLVSKDKDGYVQIVGRGKDLIISGGFNIYPKEVELVLDAQPGVLETAVIGVPHADFGETVVAVVARQQGQEPDCEQLETAIVQDLARFKHPRKYVVVDALPRNAMGKVQKNSLRSEYGDLFAPNLANNKFGM